MKTLLELTGVEFRKAIRSRMPLLTLGLFLLLPLAATFLMILVKDPEAARQMGIMSAKADLTGASADWPSFLSILAQGMATAGIFLFSLIGSWVFGREFADGVVKDWLAVPVPRGTILLAKFVVVGLWSLGIALVVTLLGIALGGLVGLPQGGGAILLSGARTVLVTALLVLVAGTPVAFFASIGRGYLLPLGLIFVMLVSAQLVAVIGWGAYFPWSIPALYGGMGSDPGTLTPASGWIVALTGLAGISLTWWWWQTADQAR
jgi:ABC-type transport system involved in multi-copper enzyme maturation permease subunit